MLHRPVGFAWGRVAGCSRSCAIWHIGRLMTQFVRTDPTRPPRIGFGGQLYQFPGQFRFAGVVHAFIELSSGSFGIASHWETTSPSSCTVYYSMYALIWERLRGKLEDAFNKKPNHDILSAKLLHFKNRWTVQECRLMQTSSPDRATREQEHGEGRLSRSDH
jgi:hypothetical protein